MGIALYILDPASTNPANVVRPWGFIRSDVAEPYGFCMGRVNGEVHALLVAKDGQGRQYRIDARQRHERQEAEDDLRADREPDAVLEFGRLPEFRKAEIGCQLVGARGHDLFPRVADRSPTTRRLCSFPGPAET